MHPKGSASNDPSRYAHNNSTHFPCIQAIVIKMFIMLYFFALIGYQSLKVSSDFTQRCEGDTHIQNSICCLLYKSPPPKSTWTQKKPTLRFKHEHQYTKTLKGLQYYYSKCDVIHAQPALNISLGAENDIGISVWVIECTGRYSQ